MNDKEKNIITISLNIRMSQNDSAMSSHSREGHSVEMPVSRASVIQKLGIQSEYNNAETNCKRLTSLPLAGSMPLEIELDVENRVVISASPVQENNQVQNMNGSNQKAFLNGVSVFETVNLPHYNSLFSASLLSDSFYRPSVDSPSLRIASSVTDLDNCSVENCSRNIPNSSCTTTPPVQFDFSCHSKKLDKHPLSSNASCSYLACSASQSNSHFEQRVPPIKLPFPCEKCPAQFNTRYFLLRHVAMHSDKKPFPCPHCPKQFKHMYYLRRHLQAHAKELVCAQCPARFKNKKSLMAHSKVHSDEQLGDHNSVQFERPCEISSRVAIISEDTVTEEVPSAGVKITHEKCYETELGGANIDNSFSPIEHCTRRLTELWDDLTNSSLVASSVLADNSSEYKENAVFPSLAESESCEMPSSSIQSLSEPANESHSFISFNPMPSTFIDCSRPVMNEIVSDSDFSMEQYLIPSSTQHYEANIEKSTSLPSKKTFLPSECRPCSVNSSETSASSASRNFSVQKVKDIIGITVENVFSPKNFSAHFNLIPPINTHSPIQDASLQHPHVHNLVMFNNPTVANRLEEDSYMHSFKSTSISSKQNSTLECSDTESLTSLSTESGPSLECNTEISALSIYRNVSAQSLTTSPHQSVIVAKANKFQAQSNSMPTAHFSDQSLQSTFPDSSLIFKGAAMDSVENSQMISKSTPLPAEPCLVNESTFFCENCSSMFKTSVEFEEHMPCSTLLVRREMDNNLEQRIQHALSNAQHLLCYQNPAGSQTKTELGVLSLKHPNDKPFFSDQRSAPFEFKSGLDSQSHSQEERPFSCTQCFARFKKKVGLTVHRKVHLRTYSNMRPFMCDTCSYSCKTYPSLKRHMRVHLQNQQLSSKKELSHSEQPSSSTGASSSVQEFVFIDCSAKVGRTVD